jgi:hypothetical protein
MGTVTVTIGVVTVAVVAVGIVTLTVVIGVLTVTAAGVAGIGSVGRGAVVCTPTVEGDGDVVASVVDERTGAEAAASPGSRAEAGAAVTRELPAFLFMW